MEDKFKNIRFLWSLYQRKMTYNEQKRVMQKVLDGKELEQAIKEEGIILFNKHPIDTTGAKELFEQKNILVEPERVVKEVDILPEDIERAQKEGFIPRPKKQPHE